MADAPQTTPDTSGWIGAAYNAGTWAPTPGVPDTDPRHWSFVFGTFGRKPACPVCHRAMEFGIAGNWTCRPCPQGDVQHG